MDGNFPISFLIIHGKTDGNHPILMVTPFFTVKKTMGISQISPNGLHPLRVSKLNPAIFSGAEDVLLHQHRGWAAPQPLQPRASSMTAP